MQATPLADIQRVEQSARGLLAMLRPVADGAATAGHGAAISHDELDLAMAHLPHAQLDAVQAWNAAGRPTSEVPGVTDLGLAFDHLRNADALLGAHPHDAWREAGLARTHIAAAVGAWHDLLGAAKQQAHDDTVTIVSARTI
jgi:hypothetical protein